MESRWKTTDPMTKTDSSMNTNASRRKTMNPVIDELEMIYADMDERLIVLKQQLQSTVSMSRAGRIVDEYREIKGRMERIAQAIEEASK
jgi:hypothetical protein